MEDNLFTSQMDEGGLPIANLDHANNPQIIKVIGVGGGGGNAVNHMYNEGIRDVSYVICNTDKKALDDSPVPNKLQLVEGLGAGNKPELARQIAEESIEDINNMLDDGTKMVFITAGMGGGTGTGAAPIIARCAKEKGILTVGIVTIPFLFEGIKKIDQALEGVEELKKHVDALLVINNERLRDIYPDLTVINAFARADDTLSVSARSIAEIITMHGKINLDFQDVRTVLKDGGVALMSTCYAEGEGRVTKAIEEAIKSPLLNNNDIFNSKKVLLYITFSDAEEQQQFTMEEMNEVHNFMSKFKDDVETKWGMATDASLGNRIKITLLTSGFGLESVPGWREANEQRTLEQIEREREDLERKTEIRGKYYTEDGKVVTHRRNAVFRFAADELDDDDLIARIEQSPTFTRTKDELQKIRQSKVKNFDSSAPLVGQPIDLDAHPAPATSAPEDDGKPGEGPDDGSVDLAPGFAGFQLGLD